MESAPLFLCGCPNCRALKVKVRFDALSNSFGARQCSLAEVT